MFQFMTSTRIVFGEGVLSSSLSVLNQYGYSVLLVSGRNTQRAKPVLNYLKQQKMRYQHVSISGEPNITMVEETAVIGRRFKPDMVVSIGGGSAIDMGKALAAIIPNQGDVYDYVEVVGRSVPLKTKPLPFIAIPTTASTGSEVTNKSVLRSGQDKVKVSLRSADILPDVAIVDPSLTVGASSDIAYRGAMETFTHLMEAYVCGDPNPLTDMICEEGIRKLSGALTLLTSDDAKFPYSDLAFSSMLGGMAISNAKLGAAHGLASSLGGKITVPHSVITARLAPYVMQENISVAREGGRDDILQRYRTIARLVTNNQHANEQDAVDWIKTTLECLKLPSLTDFGICMTSFRTVALDAMQSASIKGNPIPLTEERLIFILEQVCTCEEHEEGNQQEKSNASIEINELGYTQNETEPF
ncbi:iron-containing alcohol dehydrogenase [Vibrio sp. 99-8-1]|uniref:iron-containing alcohol dehydrogenase n=1 Tax=Vibrio sp. 99-8-1 TaxID=2607602 RepID=UPI0014938AE6|nr:iron-containing alcohol dehydrogenase [Vibrio sp. 99-8-1]NOI67489.1 iron-containing alcohol dehydrogenase [Vibrio sp. 99-8-1]